MSAKIYKEPQQDFHFAKANPFFISLGKHVNLAAYLALQVKSMQSKDGRKLYKIFVK